MVYRSKSADIRYAIKAEVRLNLTLPDQDKDLKAEIQEKVRIRKSDCKKWSVFGWYPFMSLWFKKYFLKKIVLVRTEIIYMHALNSTRMYYW